MKITKNIFSEHLPFLGKVFWLWGKEFFFETEQGNYVWNSPKYGGDNSIRTIPCSLQSYLNTVGISFADDWGESCLKTFVLEHEGDSTQVVLFNYAFYK